MVSLPPFDNIADKFFSHGKSLNFLKKLVCTFKSGGEGLQSNFKMAAILNFDDF